MRDYHLCIHFEVSDGKLLIAKDSEEVLEHDSTVTIGKLEGGDAEMKEGYRKMLFIFNALHLHLYYRMDLTEELEYVYSNDGIRHDAKDTSMCFSITNPEGDGLKNGFLNLLDAMGCE